MTQSNRRGIVKLAALLPIAATAMIGTSLPLAAQQGEPVVLRQSALRTLKPGDPVTTVFSQETAPSIKIVR